MQSVFIDSISNHLTRLLTSSSVINNYVTENAPGYFRMSISNFIDTEMFIDAGKTKNSLITDIFQT